ncbi:hypothetical protein POVCU1_006350 [Plasmodium ovale curtisi]|uniref:Uncharacterized protein n=1 Tax=Plasmodium ovale curtisi TaxID=864141 RepID=A0A1A8VNS0_PLAOA|nr:hypothetical protein POVCU1_006350 [Plasmodium ovale curtisi]
MHMALFPYPSVLLQNGRITVGVPCLTAQCTMILAHSLYAGRPVHQTHDSAHEQSGLASSSPFVLQRDVQ